MADRQSWTSMGSLALAALAVLGMGALGRGPALADSAPALPAPALDETSTQARETVVLAGGCFWGVQGVFQHVRGVTSAVSGYAGGDKDTASYPQVSQGDTGHAESVKVTFDPHQVSYGKLLQIYFSVAHDPTELNHQGPDEGTQYRSAIFPTTAEQQRIATAYVAQLGAAHVFHAPIVTRIETGRHFYPAESYHQDYLAQNPTAPYIAINDMPKVAALQHMFPGDYRSDPTLVAASGL